MHATRSIFSLEGIFNAAIASVRTVRPNYVKIPAGKRKGEISQGSSYSRCRVGFVRISPVKDGQNFTIKHRERRCGRCRRMPFRLRAARKPTWSIPARFDPTTT